MLDGHRSGRSTGRVSCKSTELKRCSMIEMQYVESMKSLLRLLCEHKFGGRVQKMTFPGKGSGGGPVDEDHMDRYCWRNESVGQGQNDMMSSWRGRVLAAWCYRSSGLKAKKNKPLLLFTSVWYFINCYVYIFSHFRHFQWIVVMSVFVAVWII